MISMVNSSADMPHPPCFFASRSSLRIRRSMYVVYCWTFFHGIRSTASAVSPSRFQNCVSMAKSLSEAGPRRPPWRIASLASARKSLRLGSGRLAVESVYARVDPVEVRILNTAHRGSADRPRSAVLAGEVPGHDGGDHHQVPVVCDVRTHHWRGVAAAVDVHRGAAQRAFGLG